MVAIAPPPTIISVPISPVSQVCPPQYRYAGDDWAGDNAFTFTVYAGGALRDLTGCKASGAVEYTAPPNPFRVPGLIWDTCPTPMIGEIDDSQGPIRVSLLRPFTNFQPQRTSLWQPDQEGFERRALLTVRASITDSYGATSTLAMVPLFVF